MDLFAHNVHVLDRKEDNSLVPVKVSDADEEQDICPSVTTGSSNNKICSFYCI